MPDYFVQHPAGLSSLIVEALKQGVPDALVTYSDDSALAFTSALPSDRVSRLPFVKNAFAVLAVTPRRDVASGIAALAKSLRSVELPAALQRQPFRTMAHVDGELAGVTSHARERLEVGLARRTGGWLQPRGECQEYWLIGRRELPTFLLAARLPKAKRPAKSRGALSHELAAALTLASKPRPSDVFLDPFGGSGSLVEARLELPSTRCIYNDTALKSHREHFSRALLSHHRVTLMGEDALVLPSVKDGEIDVIVTDPPWGEHDELPTGLDEWVTALAASFQRVLKPDKGRFVLLTSRRSALLYLDGLTAHGLPVSARHDLLVNGHPATALAGTASMPRDGWARDRSDRRNHHVK